MLEVWVWEQWEDSQVQCRCQEELVEQAQELQQHQVLEQVQQEQVQQEQVQVEQELPVQELEVLVELEPAVQVEWVAWVECQDNQAVTHLE